MSRYFRGIMFKLFSKLGLVLTVSLILNVICAFIAFKIVVSVMSFLLAIIGVVLLCIFSLYYINKNYISD